MLTVIDERVDEFDLEQAAAGLLNALFDTGNAVFGFLEDGMELAAVEIPLDVSRMFLNRFICILQCLLEFLSRAKNLRANHQERGSVGSFDVAG